MIQDRIAASLEQKNSLVVLAGIAPEEAGFADLRHTVNIAALLKDSFSYFAEQIIAHKRRVLLYEEYLLLRNFCLTQFDTVTIWRNNLYMNLQPIYAPFPQNVKKALLLHFAESETDEQDNVSLQAALRVIPIYADYCEQDGMPFGIYTDFEPDIRESVQSIYSEAELSSCIMNKPFRYCPADNVYHIISESDFVHLVKLCLDKHDSPIIRISDYTGNRELLKEHLHILEYVSQNEILLAEEKALQPRFEHRQAYTDILQKYWHHDSFRSFPVYDLKALQNHEKKIIQVSQEAVIADIVAQAERCGRGEQPRDIFVTAATGAGKSVMFQIPAIYLAQRPEKLMTLVISPLIGLMNDQVHGLEARQYQGAKTINSDISPVLKQEITEKVKDGTYDILYLSPETLLARSDVEQLIGDRTIGMIVVDEAHIVTTWGKQFRPDYWYLGDHIRKLRKNQLENKHRDLIIATFTATAIYRGREDMYEETIDSLHMIDPITYLGYVRRNDITIDIKPMPVNGESHEYELDKYEQLIKIIRGSLLMEKKTLIYFPTVSLLRRFQDYLAGQPELNNYTAVYHGQLDKAEKNENYEKFLHGDKPIMLATKAFGMGIDIDDIVRIIHFAPTGNVCDYVQEIGRAARRSDLTGEAIYNYDKRDFKHINRLHGLSSLKAYQLVGVISKIEALYREQVSNWHKRYTKKRNAMLLDAENFAYLFNNPLNDESDNINKVKTALLMIQKDFEKRRGYSPIHVRPVPMFAVGYFAINPSTQRLLKHRYHNTIKEVEPDKHICRVWLQSIWEKDYTDKSFPKFKYMLYSHDKDLEFNHLYQVVPAFRIDLTLKPDSVSKFKAILGDIKNFIYRNITTGTYLSETEIAAAMQNCSFFNGHPYIASNFIRILLASMNSYQRDLSHNAFSVVRHIILKDGHTKYRFLNATKSYFRWLENHFFQAVRERQDDKLYLVDTNDGNILKDFSIALGVLEAMGVLNFAVSGGDSSQIYIYVSQELALRNITEQPQRYHNSLLDEITARHKISVKMLTYIYEGGFSNDEIWDLIENYFLGDMPAPVANYAATL